MGEEEEKGKFDRSIDLYPLLTRNTTMLVE